MDWDLAITRNREALLRLVAAMFALLGIAPGGSVAMVHRHVRSAVLFVLGPAESAVRRLIVIEARGLEVPARARRARPSKAIPRGTGDRVPPFALFDPRKRFETDARRKFAGRDGAGPRMSTLGYDEPVFAAAPTPSTDERVTVARLCRRLQSLLHALEDLPKQARRLARWRARNAEKARRYTPLRPGKPPGHRDRAPHEVDEILADCDVLARYALRPPDT